MIFREMPRLLLWILSFIHCCSVLSSSVPLLILYCSPSDSVFIITSYPCLLLPVTQGHVFLALTSHTHCACLAMSQFSRVSWENGGAESTLMMTLDTLLLLSHDPNELGEAFPLLFPLDNNQLLQTSPHFCQPALFSPPWCWCLLHSEADLLRSWNSFISNVEPLSRGLFLSTDLTP